ncbi:MAG: ABC transporter permease [Planctomycetes bacterium]|nr:ABC transporter permease [Planctomycetota bacterium]
MAGAAGGVGFGGPGLFLIVRRSLRQHALSTAITVCSVALASGLVMAVFAIGAQTKVAFTGAPAGFDAVLGARGSQLQLVLNTVFHLETSPGQIPWKLYQEVKKHPMVELAVPYTVGDNYENFRIVGTTEEIFTKFEYAEGRRFEFQHPDMRSFNPAAREAVLGSFVAQRTGLGYGSEFHAYHGVTYDPAAIHEGSYVVTGVLKPTNSPADRVIWIPIEGVFRMEGHVLRGAGQDFAAGQGEEIPDEHKEVSAVLLKFKSPQAGMMLQQTFNRQRSDTTLAYPIGAVMADLFDKIGWMSKVLELVAYLVVAVAAGSIVASVYNTMNERRREFAILRALGARRRTVFSAIVGEAKAIALLGALLGYAVYAAILFAAAEVIRAQTGVVLDLAQAHPALYWTPLGMVVLGGFAGVVPALKAYATDVAANLAPST